MSCAVCLSELVGKKLGVLECTHEFCFECIQSWASVVNTCPLCKSRFRKIVLKSDTPKTRKQTGKVVRVADVEQEASYGPEEFAEEIYGEAREYLEEERAMEEAIALHGVRFVGFGLANYDSELDESFSGSDVSDGQDEEMVLSSSESSFSSSSSSSFEFPESSVSGTPFNAIGHDVSFRPDSSSSSSSESEASVGTKRVQRHVARYPLRTRSASAAAPRAASPPRRAASPPRRRAASPPRRRASSPPRTRRSRSGVENGNVNTRPSTRAKRINLVEDEEDDDLFDDEFELPKRKKEINLVDDDDDDDDEEVRPKRKASRRGRSTAKQSESDSIFSPS